MNKSAKKAPPSAANTRRGEVVENGSEPIDYLKKYNTGEQRAQGHIERLLQRGEVNAIPGPLLMEICGAANTRSLRAMVDRERNAGAVILSSSKGYYLPANDEEQAIHEVGRFVEVMRARAFHSLGAMSSANRYLEKLCNKEQMQLAEFEP